MTKRRDWPNAARHERDEAAIAFNDVIAQLEPLLRVRDRIVLSGEIYRRVGLALKRAQDGIRYLERAGAPTQPRED